MLRIKMLFNEYPFLPMALFIFIVFGAIGTAKQGFFVGAGIGLAVGLVFLAALFSAVGLLFGGIFLLDRRKFLQPKRQESLQYGKQFIIGAVTFLMATAAFMGGIECAMIIGAALIVLAFCASILIKARIS